MSQKYPDFLQPLADSYSIHKQYTKDATAYCYDLFIETKINQKVLKKARNENLVTINDEESKIPLSKEEYELMTFIFEDQIAVPYTLHNAPIPANKFLKRFQEKIEQTWKLTTASGQMVKEFRALTSQNNPLAFHPPKMLGRKSVPPNLEERLVYITKNSSIVYHYNDEKGIERFKYPVKMQITEEEIEDFIEEINDGQWDTYIAHYRNNEAGKIFEDMNFGRTKLATMGGAYGAVATLGTMGAYSLTPQFGLLTLISAGAVAAVTGVSALIWKIHKPLGGTIKLTNEGRNLLRLTKAYNRYKARTPDSSYNITLEEATSTAKTPFYLPRLGRKQ